MTKQNISVEVIHLAHILPQIIYFEYIYLEF